ncbi:MAG: hypothetical protein R3E79_00060 [Caldilineaceae bacterium]
MAQHIETDAVREAAGRSDIRIMPDYRGRSTLTAYAPLAIEELGVERRVAADGNGGNANSHDDIATADFCGRRRADLWGDPRCIGRNSLLTSPLRTLAAYAEQVPTASLMTAQHRSQGQIRPVWPRWRR